MDTISQSPSPSRLTPLGTSTTSQSSSSAYNIPAPTSTQPSTHDASSASTNGFSFPPQYNFPPFFTLQRNLSILSAQLTAWSSLIQSYCAHNRIFRLSLSAAANSPLFYNARLNRRLDLLSIRRVLDYMCTPEGDRRAEWVSTAPKSRNNRDATENKSSTWIYWRRPEEWADLIYAWVDSTGQKGAVLTVYELRESDAVQGQEWIGMEEELVRKCLDVLVKKGKAQVFGAEEGAGVKFF